MDGDQQTMKMGRPVKVPGGKPTSDRIFDAAINLFAEQGYDRTSVRQIARAVGVTESAVYRHYQSKEAILDAVFSYAESRVYTPIPEPPATKKPASLFRMLLLLPLEALVADPYLVKISRIMYAEMHHNESIRQYYQQEYVEWADDFITEVFREQIKNSLIRECDPRALAVIFNSFRSDWVFQNFIMNHNEPDIEKIKEEMEAPIRFFEELLLP